MKHLSGLHLHPLSMPRQRRSTISRAAVSVIILASLFCASSTTAQLPDAVSPLEAVPTASGEPLDGVFLSIERIDYLFQDPPESLRSKASERIVRSLNQEIPTEELRLDDVRGPSRLISLSRMVLLGLFAFWLFFIVPRIRRAVPQQPRLDRVVVTILLIVGSFFLLVVITASTNQRTCSLVFDNASPNTVRVTIESDSNFVLPPETRARQKVLLDASQRELKVKLQVVGREPAREDRASYRLAVSSDSEYLLNLFEANTYTGAKHTYKAEWLQRY